MHEILKKSLNFKFFAVLLLSLGVLFRGFNPGLYTFGFDQIQILSNAEAISQGNLTLIGPRTGPAEMFTGPLVYYIAAVFIYILGSPMAIVGMSVSIATVTGLGLFFLSKKYLSINASLIFLFVWALSPFFIHFDRIAWNPNLTLLSAMLVFFPLLKVINDKKVSNLEYFFISAGSFLGFQAHFSGLILPAMLIISLIFFKRFSIKPVIASLGGFFISVLPTLLFDAKNNWLNIRGLLSFITEKESVGGTLFFDRLRHTVEVTLEIMGSMFPIHLEKQVAIYIGLLMLVVLFWKLLKKKISLQKEVQVSIFWVVSIMLIFTLYRSKSPEYYFFIFLPAVFVFLSELISPLLRKKVLEKRVVLIAIIIISLFTFSNISMIVGENSLNLSNQQRMALNIKAYAQRTPVEAVSYDVLNVDSLGMRYFIDKYVEFKDGGKLIHISNLEEGGVYGNYGLWVDPRTDPELNYIVTDNIVLESSSDTMLMGDKYLGSKFGPHETFQIIKGGEFTGDALVLVRDLNNPFLAGNETYRELKDNALEKQNRDSWKVISYGDYQGYLKEYQGFVLVYVTQKTLQEFLEVSADINAIDIRPGVL